MLATAQRVGLDVDKAEQATDETLDLVADDLGLSLFARCLHRPDDVETDTSIRTWRVNGEGRAFAQVGDAIGTVFPTGQAFGPHLRLGGGVLGH